MNNWYLNRVIKWCATGSLIFWFETYDLGNAGSPPVTLLVTIVLCLIAIWRNPPRQVSKEAKPPLDYLDTPISQQELEELAHLEKQLKRPLTYEETVEVLGPGRLENPDDDL